MNQYMSSDSWSQHWKSYLQANLSHREAPSDVTDMISQISSLAVTNLVNIDQSFRWLANTQVKCVSPSALAEFQFEPLSGYLQSAFRTNNHLSELGIDDSDPLPSSLMNDATELYCSPIGRLAEWQATQYELMLPQSSATLIHVPWLSLIRLAESTEPDLGMLALFTIMESMIAATIINSDEYISRVTPILQDALAFDTVDQELLFDRAWRMNPNPGPDEQPIEIVDSEAMLDAFLSPHRREAFQRLAGVIGMVSAARRWIVLQVASKHFPSGDASTIQLTLDNYRAQAPKLFDAFLHVSLGTHVRGIQWEYEMSKLESMTTLDVSSIVQAAIHGFPSPD